MRQGRITGAEIINGNTHAGFTEAAQGFCRRYRIVHDGAFRQLDFQHRGGNPGAFDPTLHMLQQVILIELLGRQVHRHAQLRPVLELPFGELGAGHAQDQIAQGRH